MRNGPDYDRQQHLCACEIDLNNERYTTVTRDATNPVSWPEILLLQAIHGDDAVYDIRPVAIADRPTPAAEKHRLAIIYGNAAVEAVFAGRAFVMEWFVPGWAIDPDDWEKKPAERPRPPRIRAQDDGALDAR